MCPPGYHHNGFVATHALGHIMDGYTLLVLIAEDSVLWITMTTYVTLLA